MDCSYWNKEWENSDIDELNEYLKHYAHADNHIIHIFREHGVQRICNAACGFGAYSLLCATNGFRVYGFDIAETSIKITQELLSKYNVDISEYKVSNIINIDFPDKAFDAVIAHAVIDHLPYHDAKLALKELKRIIKPEGLAYISFDRLDESDIDNAHEVLEDGSFQYSNGLLFRYYTEEDISSILREYQIIYRGVNSKGDREIVFINR